MVIPTPEEVIEWAKQNKFRFKQNGFGTEKCGCALTAIWCMKHTGKFKIEDMDFASDDFRLTPSMQFKIIRGFDSPNIDINEEYRNWGRNVYNLAKQEGLLI